MSIEWVRGGPLYVIIYFDLIFMNLERSIRRPDEWTKEEFQSTQLACARWKMLVQCSPSRREIPNGSNGISGIGHLSNVILFIFIDCGQELLVAAGRLTDWPIDWFASIEHWMISQSDSFHGFCHGIRCGMRVLHKLLSCVWNNNLANEAFLIFVNKSQRYNAKWMIMIILNIYKWN